MLCLVQCNVFGCLAFGNDDEMQGQAKEWSRVASMKALAAFQKFKADKDFIALPWASTFY